MKRSWRALLGLVGLGARRLAGGRLRGRDLSPDPLRQYMAWMDEAEKGSGMVNPNALCLSTLGADGWPEGRMVLLKGADAKGFVFYTNLQSDKGLALERDPRAELVFYWDRLGRQLRVQGAVASVAAGEADAYFASRSRGSQIAAWASDQSRVAPSREEMDRRYQAFEEKFKGSQVPRPPHWSGYRLAPRRYEFWQADPLRFHDRFRYTLVQDAWSMKRIYP